MLSGRFAFLAVLLCVSLSAFVPAVSADLSRDYDETEARAFCLLSAIAYCPTNVVTNFSCTGCSLGLISDFHIAGSVYLQSDDIFAYIGWLKPVDNVVSVVVVFRGTRSTKDWIDDLQVDQIDFRPNISPGMKIHKGFYDSYMSVDANIQSIVQNIFDQFPQMKVNLICTGHSLGAALAEVACLQLMDYAFVAPRLNSLPTVYNYGQPRVGNAAFASWADTQFNIYFRLTHYRDIVPHIPVKAPGDAYIHGGVEVWYTEDCSSHQVCQQGEDPKCSDSMVDDSIPDHLSYLGFDIGSDNPYC
eukprot:ANDGO_03776.mRNA.1 Lipase